MNKSTITVHLPSDNPWFPGEQVELERAEVEKLARIAADAAEALRARNFQNSYSYDQPVMAALAPHLPADPIAMLRGIEKVLWGMLDLNDWHDGANAARRVISTTNAYATPGFAAARHGY
ncbi:MAG: hypothetical protein QGG54_15535 [Gammaproteobacteria bacterium]|nr:hypothetical protein [Gammaproteobacteria bacterium]